MIIQLRKQIEVNRLCYVEFVSTPRTGHKGGGYKHFLLYQNFTMRNFCDHSKSAMAKGHFHVCPCFFFFSSTLITEDPDKGKSFSLLRISLQLPAHFFNLEPRVLVPITHTDRGWRPWVQTCRSSA